MLIQLKSRITVLLMAAALGVFAQNSSDVQSFTLDQAIDYALMSRTDIMNAEADVEIARAQKKEVFGSGLPQVNASVEFQNFFQIPKMVLPASMSPTGEPQEVSFQRQFNTSAGISATQLLFSGTYIVAVQNSSEFIELAEMGKAKTETDAAINVAKAYYSILINREKMSLLDKNVRSLEKIMNETQKLYEAGFVQKIDADRIKVTYNNLTVERENVNKLMELGKMALKFQMGYNLYDEIILADSLDLVLVSDASTDLSNFKYDDRIDYQMVEKQVMISRKLLKLERSGYLPTVALFASYSQQGQSDEFNIFNDNAIWNPVGVVGFQINLNLFDGLQRNYRIEKKRLEIAKAENTRNMVRKSMDMETTSAKITLDNSMATIENQRLNMELAQEVLDAASKKYSSGTGSSMEVIEAENALKEAHTNYYNALYNAIVAKLDFEKATGKFDIN